MPGCSGLTADPQNLFAPSVEGVDVQHVVLYPSDPPALFSVCFSVLIELDLNRPEDNTRMSAPKSTVSAASS